MEEIREVLGEIGLSEREITIYMAMIKVGENTASQISQVAKMNRITTYTLLKSLKEKGYCSIYQKNNIQYFKPIRPEQILGLLEEKKKRIKILLPEINKNLSPISDKPEISLFEGKKGLAAMFDLLLKDAENKREVLGYGNVSCAEKVFQQQSTFWRKTRLEKKIKMRAVSDSLGDIEHRSPAIWKKITEVRTNKDFAKLGTYTIITENYVSHSTLKEGIFGILIKSKEIAAKEKLVFENFWKQAK